MKAFTVPPIRPEYDRLLEAERLSRSARRMIGHPETGTAPVSSFAARELIDNAIAELVVARVILASSEVAA